MTRTLHEIQNTEQYQLLIKLITRVFETPFKILDYSDNSQDYTDSQDFEILVKFPNFDKSVLLSLGRSGTSYQATEFGYFGVSLEKKGEWYYTWKGEQFRSLEQLLKDSSYRFGVYADEKNEEKQLAYFQKLKDYLEKIQKEIDERKWEDKHSFGF